MPRGPRLSRLALLPLLMAAGLAAWWATQERRAVTESDTPAVRPRPANRPRGPRAAALPSSPDEVREPSTSTSLPPSLAGAEPDGAIGWNPDGTVRVDRALRLRFDFLLSGLGEVTLARLRAQLKSEVDAVTSPERAARVVAAFDRYVAYLSALDGLAGAPGPERLVALHALREEKLGREMARAFFEDEEQRDALALERQALAHRGELGEDERREALAAAEARRSATERTVLERGALVATTVAETRRLEADAASPEERRAAREARLGVEAARRLADLDDARARWAARVAAFRAARDAIDGDASLPPVSRQQALEALLERDFSLPERRRLRALELAPH